MYTRKLLLQKSYAFVCSIEINVSLSGFSHLQIFNLRKIWIEGDYMKYHFYV